MRRWVGNLASEFSSGFAEQWAAAVQAGLSWEAVFPELSPPVPEAPLPVVSKTCSLVNK